MIKRRSQCQFMDATLGNNGTESDLMGFCHPDLPSWNEIKTGGNVAVGIGREWYRHGHLDAIRSVDVLTFLSTILPSAASCSVNIHYRPHLHVVYPHDDSMPCKGFPHYWPFVRGIHRSPMDSPHTGSVMRSFDIFFPLSLKRCWINCRVAGDLTSCVKQIHFTQNTIAINCVQLTHWSYASVALSHRYVHRVATGRMHFPSDIMRTYTLCNFGYSHHSILYATGALIHGWGSYAYTAHMARCWR